MNSITSNFCVTMVIYPKTLYYFVKVRGKKQIIRYSNGVGCGAHMGNASSNLASFILWSIFSQFPVLFPLHDQFQSPKKQILSSRNRVLLQKSTFVMIWKSPSTSQITFWLFARVFPSTQRNPVNRLNLLVCIYFISSINRHSPCLALDRRGGAHLLDTEGWESVRERTQTNY